MTPCFLYRFFDSEDRLLYVGISHRLENRFNQHRQAKPWGEIARIDIEQYPSREEALDAERQAIGTESPVWNVMWQREGVGRRPLKTDGSYMARAHNWWPGAEWINGKGRWASLAYCDVLTIFLHETQEEAQKSLDWIGRVGCGHRCYNDHKLVDLDRKPPKEAR